MCIHELHVDHELAAAGGLPAHHGKDGLAVNGRWAELEDLGAGRGFGVLGLLLRKRKRLTLSLIVL